MREFALGLGEWCRSIQYCGIVLRWVVVGEGGLGGTLFDAFLVCLALCRFDRCGFG